MASMGLQLIVLVMKMLSVEVCREFVLVGQLAARACHEVPKSVHDSDGQFLAGKFES
jgi:hypothetical protein